MPRLATPMLPLCTPSLGLFGPACRPPFLPLLQLVCLVLKGIDKIRSAHNYRDEFHKEPNATTNTVTFMKGLGGKPFNTWFSGTTAEEPKDLLGFCEVAWKNCGSTAKAHELWSKFDHDGLKRLDDLVKSRNKDLQNRSLTTW